MNNKLLGKFLKVLLITFFGALIVILAGTYLASIVSKSNIATQHKTSDFSNKKNVVAEHKDELEDKTMTTVAVFGVAQGDSTDANMLVFFNHETLNIDVVSIPEDTRVKIPDELYKNIKQNRADARQIVMLKEVPSMVTAEKNETSVAVLEKSLGVDIDYYVNVDMEAFRKAVNIIGEIPVNIPFNMKYSDNKQQFFINLEKGEQKLNGVMAEQFVRFVKGYDSKEMGRINSQQVFMKAFLKEALNDKNRLNMINIMTEVLKYIKTDFTKVIDYLVYLPKINEENFRFHTLPGRQEVTDRDYYIYDLNKTKELIGKIVNNEEILPELIIDVKSLPISVQNGTNIKGLAGRNAEKLKLLGYKVAEAVNYENNKVKRTKIIAGHEEVFEELRYHFNNPEMLINEELSDKKNKIIIVLGTDDPDK